jgi:hypothetical protein
MSPIYLIDIASLRGGARWVPHSIYGDGEHR